MRLQPHFAIGIRIGIGIGKILQMCIGTGFGRNQIPCISIIKLLVNSDIE